jgi:hypothetical protein
LRVVTTCHKAGWEQYGQQCLDGLKKWPADAEIIWYTEGFDLPAQQRVREVKGETLERLQAFKAKWRHYRAPDWRFDVVRFANKAFALYDALRDYDGLGVWMDADIVTHKRMPKQYLPNLLPASTYVALFQRDGVHSETGLVLFDGSHPQHRPFMDAYIEWYESGRFRGAHEWHDCIVMDAVVRSFERNGLVRSHNLSGKASNTSHPMAVHSFAQYADHLKGPSRKALGHSPERKVA